MDTQPAHLTGLDAVEAATELLRRVRWAHPTKGLFEAGDVQWRWRMERPTDVVPQLFWLDGAGHPEAAAILTDWGSAVGLDPIVMPDASAAWIAHVVDRGLAHAAAAGFDTVELEVDRADAARRKVLAAHGFEITGDGVVETWLAASERPPIGPLPDGYRLADRALVATSPHHMVGRSGPAVEARLRQTSLYRPDLDLVVLAADSSVAAYGLCWLDPETATGLVEPMRTEDAHQRRGLARHVLTAGLDRLATAGAKHIKICFEPANPASSHLYLSAGFRPTARTERWSGPTVWRGRLDKG